MSAPRSSPTREMRVSGAANGAQMRRRERDEARRWGEGEEGRKRVEEGYMSQKRQEYRNLRSGKEIASLQRAHSDKKRACGRIS
ncbi:hypothetical protein EYF80_002410 [Liparis tanakae]|uniref:Uncharacterized protein n=1 Tax=Liparis tanakae TaxID=230148 RepID=A0A4Z2JC53_9TELE|nr:hypothetical protein EYF80_002410 [Liparis tanakae]